MRYTYFVSYTYVASDGSGFGRIEIVRDAPIFNFDDIEEVEREIERGTARTVTIMNYICMED